MKLKINETQAKTIIKALDLYSRLQMGQIHELGTPYSGPFTKQIEKADKEKLEDILNELKQTLFPELSQGAFYGIFSQEVPDEAKISYDMIQVIRNHLAWKNNPKGGITVDFDQPLKSSKEPLIEILEKRVEKVNLGECIVRLTGNEEQVPLPEKFDSLQDKKEIARNAEIRLEKQRNYLRGYFHSRGMYQSLKALEIAFKYHTNKRKGGQPEITHQFELVSYALPIFEKYETIFLDRLISALLLHDTLEDYDRVKVLKDLESSNFDKETLSMIFAVTKKEGFSKTEKEYQEYYNGIVKNQLAIIVKMIDRLHNIESMLECPEIFTLKKREKYIEETEKYIIPSGKQIRREKPELYQPITFLIRELKTYISFTKRINELDH